MRIQDVRECADDMGMPLREEELIAVYLYMRLGKDMLKAYISPAQAVHDYTLARDVYCSMRAVLDKDTGGRRQHVD